MFRILIADPLKESGLAIFRDAGADIHLLAEGDRPRLAELVADMDALVVRSMTQVDAELLKAGKRLKVVGRAGIGVDNVDVATATDLGIVVVNAPTANLISATEHTFALLLAVARNVPAADRSLREGEWARKKFLGVELHGRTLGVVGLGRIGQQVAARARAFGMKVQAFDPFLEPAVAKRLDIELSELDDLLGSSDVVTLHTPLTEQTHNLLDRERIARMQPGALLLNCARGGIVDEEALLEALDEGHLGGAALDVFAQEPPANAKLLGHPRVVVTPHIGAQTQEAQDRVATETARMVLAALDGSLAVTAVNLPFIATGPLGQQLLGLAEQLGRLGSSVIGGSLQEVKVGLWGIEEGLEVPLTIAAIKGALTPFLGDAVNFVNAERVAESRGVEVVRSSHHQPGEYAQLVELEFSGEAGTTAVAGTLFGNGHPWVVSFEGYRLEFRPKGWLLVLRNRDVPGVVGKVGTLLGESGVNIAEIHLARKPGGDEALAVLRLDQELPQEVVEGLSSLSEVNRVQTINLEEI